MLEKIPTNEEMIELIGPSLFEVWLKLSDLIEASRDDYSMEVQKIYDSSTTYHDEKWMMFELVDTSLFNDMEKLLQIKRKPNKK